MRMSSVMGTRVQGMVPRKLKSMDVAITSKRERNLIKKTWERCKSIGRGNQKFSSESKSLPRSLTADASPENDKSNKRKQRGTLTPDGCFSVYVGLEKERFAVKTKHLNHPLFKLLLEEAESEYGFHRGGPIELPCSLNTFYRVLVEIDDDGDSEIHRAGCSNFSMASPASYRLLSPSRMWSL